jgi:hypothetical protein
MDSVHGGKRRMDGVCRVLLLSVTNDVRPGYEEVTWRGLII